MTIVLPLLYLSERAAHTKQLDAGIKLDYFSAGCLDKVRIIAM